MNKPNGYDSVKVGGFVPVITGGHNMVIKKVVETKNKKGNDMIVVMFDFDETDKQPNYFMDSFKEDLRPDKKWPYAGTSYINVNDKFGNASKSFKTFVDSAEHSNGFTAKWNVENWGEQFKGKKIGGVFGQKESEYNGKTSMRTELFWFCDYASAKAAKVPEPKMLQVKESTPTPSFDDDLPF